MRVDGCALAISASSLGGTGGASWLAAEPGSADALVFREEALVEWPTGCEITLAEADSDALLTWLKGCTNVDVLSAAGI